MSGIKGYLQLATVRAATRVLNNCSGRIADVGCGNGNFPREANKKTIGIDHDWNQALDAGKTGMPVILGDMLSMPFKDGTFDAVVCLNTIYNYSSLSELEPAFAEMSRVAKKEGVIVVDIRNKRNPFLRIKYWLHMTRKDFPTIAYSSKDMEATLRKAGYRLLQKSVVGIDNSYLAWGYVMVFERIPENK